MMQPKKRMYRNDVSQQTREKQSIAHQGRGWRINAEKLDKLLSDNPDVLRGVLKKD